MSTIKDWIVQQVKSAQITLLAILILPLFACSSGGGNNDEDQTAAPPPVPALLGSRSSNAGGFITRFDLPSGPPTRLNSLGPPGYANVSALAFDGRFLYGFDRSTDTLIKLNPGTGEVTEVGPAGRGSIEGLAYDSFTAMLYGVGLTNLWSIDPATAETTLVGPMALSSGTNSLAYHPPSRKLFTVARNTGDLYSVDPANAAATLVGNIGGGLQISGLAYNSLSGMLDAVDSASGNIVQINPANAKPSVIGASGFCCISGLAFNPRPGRETLYAVESADKRLMTIAGDGSATPVGAAFGSISVSLVTLDSRNNVLYAIDQRINHLVRVDRDTGETTDIGATGFPVMHGMTYDFNSDRLYGSYSFGGQDLLLEFDRGTGAATSLGSVTGITPLALGDIAFDPDSNTLYATNMGSGSAELITIDPSSRVATTVNTIGFASVRGLVFHPGSDILYGLDDLTDEFIVIDTAPGSNPSGTLVGTTPFNSGWGLGLDPESSNLLGADIVNGSDLLSIDTANGNAVAIGSLGYSSVQGMAFDRNTGTVYGSASGLLLTFDTTTGQANAITLTGKGGPPFLFGLAYDPNLDVLYGIDTTSTLFSIDTATGATKSIGAVGAGALLGLAFDPNSSTLYAAGGQVLFLIDTSSGAWTSVWHTGIGPIGGLGYDDDTDTLYASTTGAYEIYTIDPLLLTTTFIGSSGYAMDGLTYALVP